MVSAPADQNLDSLNGNDGIDTSIDPDSMAVDKARNGTQSATPSTITQPKKEATPVRLSPDHTFHFELLRVLAHARHGAADINEVLLAAGKIIPGDFESWYEVFLDLANRTRKRAQTLQNPIAQRDAFFHASTYYRAADFYIHGDKDQRRIDLLWGAQIECFNAANRTLLSPGRRSLIQAGGFYVPIIFFSGGFPSDRTKRPTVMMLNGFDGSQEEMYHQHGRAAFDRGWNVITFEGPGQCSVRRDQDLGFIAEWERVITPVVDYLSKQPNVDMSKIVLFGNSMGACWAARAAAFEHRLAALILVDGVYDVYEQWTDFAPKDADGKILSPAARIQGLDKGIANGTADTTTRWAIDHGAWAFKCSREEVLEKTKMFTVKDIIHKIKCPVWVGCAADDLFVKNSEPGKSQPEKVRAALGDRATYRKLTDEDAAGSHCHVGAATLLNQIVYDWFEETFLTPKNITDANNALD